MMTTKKRWMKTCKKQNMKSCGAVVITRARDASAPTVAKKTCIRIFAEDSPAEDSLLKNDGNAVDKNTVINVIVGRR